MGKAFNGSFHAGLLVFGLIMQVRELMLFTVRTVDGFEPVYVGKIQVQNLIFLDCPTMIAFDFCVKSYGCFKFDLLMF